MDKIILKANAHQIAESKYNLQKQKSSITHVEKRLFDIMIKVAKQDLDKAMTTLTAYYIASKYLGGFNISEWDRTTYSDLNRSSKINDIIEGDSDFLIIPMH